MHNFRQLEIWKNGVKISLEIYHLTKLFPKEELYGIVNQLRRSSVSIPSNIAEGSGKSSYKDFNRFLEIALGSAFELETQLLTSKDLKYLKIQD